MYALLDAVESDLDEDAGNEMNNSGKRFFGNYEVDCNSGFDANAFDILVQATNVHSLSSGNPPFITHPVLEKISNLEVQKD